MAITGTGAQDDPYIVHSYEEIKTAINDCIYTTIYLTLANDIDCNDYGDDWEWKTITTKKSTYFDLNKHTIKNVLIATDNYMFDGVFTIKNGKILNVFCNMASGIFKSTTLQNVSASLSATNCKGNVIYAPNINTPIKNCAIYIKAGYLRRPLIDTTTGNGNIVNSDLWFDIEDLNNNIITSGNGGSYPLTFSGCRIRGYAKGSNVNMSLFDRSKAISCLIDFDLRNMNLPSTFVGSYTQIFGMGNFHTEANAINKDKMYNGNNARYGGGRCDCTEEQLHDADFLNSIGFEVVKLEEA